MVLVQLSRVDMPAVCAVGHEVVRPLSLATTAAEA
jgi:hypothetical protein